MRLHRRPRTRGKFGRTLIEIDYADGGTSGQMPIAFLPDGATKEQHAYAWAWLKAVRGERGVSVDAFIPRNP